MSVTYMNLCQFEWFPQLLFIVNNLLSLCLTEVYTFLYVLALCLLSCVTVLTDNEHLPKHVFNNNICICPHQTCSKSNSLYKQQKVLDSMYIIIAETFR